MKIPLGKDGKWFAEIDRKDFARVSKYSWSVDFHGTNVYARTSIMDKKTGKKKKVYLHRFVVRVRSPKIFVDHRDGDGLNCKSKNLRKTSPLNNSLNRVKTPNSTSSIYKGVTRISDAKYRAVITIDGKQVHLGYFAKPTDAARAYDKAALQHAGQFAKTNFLSSVKHFGGLTNAS